MQSITIYWFRNLIGWETGDWSKSCESVFIVSSTCPLSAGGKQISQKVLLRGITIFVLNGGRLHFGGRSSAKEPQIIKGP